MHYKTIIHINGYLLLGIALAMLIPGLVGELLGESDAIYFLISSGVAALLGAACVRLTRQPRFRMYPKQAFLLTASAWLVVSLYSALPFVLIQHIDYSDAFFETMSGITTTGSTVLVNLEQLPRCILLWRSLLQWFGGLGFMVMAVAMLPFLGVGGMRIFKSESSDWSEKSMPHMRSVAVLMAVAYAGLTTLCMLAYVLAGMSWFDAVNHAMTTISTGGYSTYDQSLGYFDSPAVLLAAIVFMVLAALPFSRYVQMMRGDVAALWRDEQVRGFMLFLTMTTLVLTLWLTLVNHDGPLDNLLRVAFSVVSVVTTTGFTNDSYDTWGSFAVIAFLLLMFVGGCSGSTAGAAKIFRFQIALRVLRANVARQVHPRGVFLVEYNRHLVDDDILRSILSFTFAFLAIVALLALALAAFGLDPMTSLSASITAVTNVGPGIGPVVGPAANFAAVPDPAKWLLAVGMLLGRLEIMTLTVLLSRHFWRT